METFTVAQAKRQFSAIVAGVEATDAVVGITSRGRVVAVVLSAADYRELTEVVPGFGGSASAQIDESAARRALESEVVRRHARILAEHAGKEPLSQAVLIKTDLINTAQHDPSTMHRVVGGKDDVPVAGTWHPVLAAVEISTAVWSLQDQFGEYGRVELRRTVDGLRYRCEHRGELIGWATTLRRGCSEIHGAYLRAHGPGEHRGYPDLSGSSRITH